MAAADRPDVERLDPTGMDVATAVARWRLEPHPERGFYRRTYTSPVQVTPPGGSGPRALATAILYLLPAGERSLEHRVRSEELWCWQGGAPMELHVEGARHVLGPDPSAGHEPQAVVPPGAWQSATPAGGPWSLVTCVVVPGFDWADFELRSTD